MRAQLISRRAKSAERVCPPSTSSLHGLVIIAQAPLPPAAAASSLCCYHRLTAFVAIVRWPGKPTKRAGLQRTKKGKRRAKSQEASRNGDQFLACTSSGPRHGPRHRAKRSVSVSCTAKRRGKP